MNCTIETHGGKRNFDVIIGMIYGILVIYLNSQSHQTQELLGFTVGLDEGTRWSFLAKR